MYVITLQYRDGFCHTAAWIGHKYTRDPPSWTHSHFPPHPVPLGFPGPLGALLHTSNLPWPSILHMIMYMFQCCSLKSSQPHLLPQSPKVCSLHLCLLCCPACKIIGTIFLNNISIHFKPITISLAMIVTIHTCYHITFLLIIFHTLYIYITLCTLLHYVHSLHMTHLFCNWKFAHVNLPHLFLCFYYTLPLENTYLFSVPIIVCFWYVYSSEFFRLYITWNHKILVFVCLAYFTQNNIL